MGDNRAVAPLIRAIRKPTNVGFIGTLVYSLQTLDCSKHFTFLFNLALNADYEPCCMALMILQEKRFRTTKQQLQAAAKKLTSSERRLQNKNGRVLFNDLKRCLKRQSKPSNTGVGN
ncbi:MAG: hypothetical protein NTV22_13875 [bacterium]|nr:hypothetical protein [bacterium]